MFPRFLKIDKKYLKIKPDVPNTISIFGVEMISKGGEASSSISTAASRQSMHGAVARPHICRNEILITPGKFGKRQQTRRGGKKVEDEL